MFLGELFGAFRCFSLFSQTDLFIFIYISIYLFVVKFVLKPRSQPHRKVGQSLGHNGSNS